MGLSQLTVYGTLTIHTLYSLLFTNSHFKKYETQVLVTMWIVIFYMVSLSTTSLTPSGMQISSTNL